MTSVRLASRLARQVAHVWQKLYPCNFLTHYMYGKCKTLHDSSTHGALPIHTIFSDFDFISRSQQCITVFTENFIFLSD